MKYIKTLYCWIVSAFFVGFTIFFGILFSLIFPITKIDPYLKKFFRLFIKAVFLKVEAEGLEKIDPKKSYIFIPNHVSFADPFVLNAYIPNMIRGIETSKHFKWPLYGQFIKRYGNIPIDQRSIRKSLKSFEKAQNYLKNGKSIVVFPEGERSHTGEVAPFKRLPFLLTQRAGVDIVPVGLSGLYSFLNRHTFIMHPGKAKIKFGDVIPYEEIMHKDTKVLKEEVRQKVIDLYEFK